MCNAGEHSMIMLSSLQSASVEGTDWLMAFVQDFRLRFRTLLAGSFRTFSPGLAMSILDPKITFTDGETHDASSGALQILKSDGTPLSAFDLRRLQVGYSLHLQRSLFLCMRCLGHSSVACSTPPCFTILPSTDSLHSQTTVPRSVAW